MRAAMLGALWPARPSWPLSPCSPEPALRPLGQTRPYGRAANVPADGDFEAIFTPVFVSVPAVKAPTSRLAGAFKSLNQLFRIQNRLDEVVVALRISLDRAERELRPPAISSGWGARRMRQPSTRSRRSPF